MRTKDSFFANLMKLSLTIRIRFVENQIKVLYFISRIVPSIYDEGIVAF